MEPYWSDGQVTLYLGDCREVLPALDVTADLVLADPPYGETSLAWDRWPDGWLDIAASVTNSLWCFGSLRMFLDRRDEFKRWKLSQDVVWEKNAGAGTFNDRFRRVHDHAVFWYRGLWRDIYHAAPRYPAVPLWSGREMRPGSTVLRRPNGGSNSHLGPRRAHEWQEDGTRLMRSVIKAKNLRGLGLHPTEKPLPLLLPLVKYACPPGGLVVDPFAGSGSTLDAARLSGSRAIGIEADERYIERAALRLSQGVLDHGAYRIGEVMIKTCGRCGGSGQIPAVMTYRDCPDCDGTGQVDTGSDDD